MDFWAERTSQEVMILSFSQVRSTSQEQKLEIFCSIHLCLSPVSSLYQPEPTRSWAHLTESHVSDFFPGALNHKELSLSFDLLQDLNLANLKVNFQFLWTSGLSAPPKKS